jgi:hypothetical protein
VRLRETDVGVDEVVQFEEGETIVTDPSVSFVCTLPDVEGWIVRFRLGDAVELNSLAGVRHDTTRTKGKIMILMSHYYRYINVFLPKLQQQRQIDL